MAFLLCSYMDMLDTLTTVW